MRAVGRNLQSLLIVVTLPALLASCGDGLLLRPDPATLDRVPVLTTSVSSLVLAQANFDETAVEFSWTPGSNRGTSAAIDYALEFDTQDGNIAAPVRVPLGRAVYSKRYTVAELNTFLTETLNVTPGAAANLRVRLKSTIAGGTFEPDTSNLVSLSATPYEPVSTTLFLIGSAAPTGWSADDAPEMQANPTRPFVFTYQGSLSPGELKFITTRGQFLPSYNRGSSNTRLFYRTDDAQPDDKFIIGEPGQYRVTANLVALTLSIEKLAGPPYNELWAVGDATPTGWSLDDAFMMRQDPGDPFLFDYNAVLQAGEFKIATAKDWGAPFYRPTSDRPPLTDTGVQLSAGDPDHKWYIAEPGAYKITLNVREMTISIQKFTPYARLWIVGDATPNGWNIDNPTEMQAHPEDPYVFTYTGPLSVGEFKIPVRRGDWGADYFMPAIPHPPLESTYVRFVPGGQPDNKWHIAEPGTYRVTLNQLYETILIEKL
jgi:starch-binding outer membrane protein SusE/F